MRGRPAHGAEVVGGFDESFAEMVLPDAVDHDARGQRVLRAGDMGGKLAATAAGFLRRNEGAAEHGDKPSRDFLAEIERLAALLDPAVPRSAIGHGVGHRDFRNAVLERVAFGPDAAEGFKKLQLRPLRLNGRRTPLGFVARRAALGLQVLQLLVDGGQLFVERGHHGLVLLGRHQRHEVALPLLVFRSRKRIPRALENAVERIVVAHRHRIELVVVAARAAQREAHGRAAQRVERVLDRLVHGGVGIHAEPARLRDEPGGHDLAVARRLVGRRQQIAGDLFAQELVVRRVAVEGVDHVVAVQPGLWDRIVAALAGRVGIPGDIQPVAPPPLAVARRGEKSRGRGFQRARRAARPRGLAHHGIQFAGLGRQACQHEAQAPHERLRRRLRAGRKPVRFEFGQDEPVDRRPHPGGLAHRGRLGIGQRSERPAGSRRRRLRPRGCQAGEQAAAQCRNPRCAQENHPANKGGTCPGSHPDSFAGEYTRPGAAQCAFGRGLAAVVDDGPAAGECFSSAKTRRPAVV